MKNLQITSLLILLSALFLFSCATTQPAVTESAATDQEKPSDFDKAIENTVPHEGLFTVYRDTTDGSATFAIHKDQIGKEFIYFGMAENGVVDVGTFRGQYRDNKVIHIDRYYDRVEFVEVNNRYYFDEESPLSNAAEANISEAILHSAEIEVEDDSTGTLLIDGDALILSESLHQIKPSPNPRANPNRYTLGSLSREKTKYDEIRSFPKNTDFIVDYVYDSPYPRGGTSSAVTDRRSVTLKYQHTFIEMPENDYQPRFDDPRVGYFMTQQDDQSTAEATPYRDMIHRWHLVKKNPDAELSEPVEPIVWWIENTTPHEFRETIKEATLAWNEAFEAAGFKNAVQVKVQPDDAEWDAADIRYNVLRWTSSPNPPFGGYGPSFVNPKTGQILGADIMLEWVFFTNRAQQQDLFDAEASLLSDEDDSMSPGTCSIGHHMHMNNLFGRNALMAMNATDEELEGFNKEALTMLILHELGHTFALNHNMQASTLHSPEDIHDKNLADTIGLTGSVMDYSSVNVNNNRENQGRYFDIKPGPYDIWAIQYGYTTIPDDPEAGQAALDEILARSTEHELSFGNDADDMRAPGKAIDPRVMIGDMSSDPVAYGAERIELTRTIMDGLLEKYGAREGQSYQELRNAFMSLMGQYSVKTGVFSRQIGGVYRDRGFIGQPGAETPFIPVPAETQKRAMEHLARYLFAPDAFSDSHEVYNYLQTQRRGFSPNYNGEDPKIHSMVLAMQQNVFAHLLHPNTMERITNSRLYGNEYGVADVTGDLTDAIFSADADGNVNTFRQNLQIEYVNRLIAITGSDDHDHMAKSAALYNLQQIDDIVSSKRGVNTETAAHSAHIALLIKKAMEA